MAQPSPRYAKKRKEAFDLYYQGRYPEAHKLAAQLCTAKNRDVEIRGLLGHTLLRLGRLAEARACFRALVDKVPHSWHAHYDLASVCHLLGYHEEAVTHFRRAERLNPDEAAIPDSIAIDLCCQGRHEEAIQCHRRALDLDPTFVRGYSNLLLTLHYQPDPDPDALFLEHLRWGKAHGDVAVLPPPQNNNDPNRCLRVAYISNDFRTHSVAYFIEPLLFAHSRDVVEVWCYTSLQDGDTTTGRLRSLADRWREIAGMSPRAAAQRIRNDRIDILVDLGGHTSSDILRVFAHRPAPVQITYLGYPDTTGLPSIDYRLCDEATDPREEPSRCTEEVIRLPGCFLCYQPFGANPPVTRLPAARNGHVTFGSFNNLAKINQRVVALWADLLRQVEEARLFIKNPSFTDPPTRDRYYELFQAHGVPRERIDLQGRTETVADHLALYGRLDIALDTFPYNGTTTTCEALWMGVPVITLTGSTHAGRVGTSLLRTVGLRELVARDRDHYLEIAAGLAADREYLAALRTSLRDRLMSSPLCDAEPFTRHLEETYRTLWRRWCAADRP
jgi:Flp pilus assembly protein TadD